MNNSNKIESLEGFKLNTGNFPDITPTNILKEVETNVKRFKAKPHKEILNALLSIVSKLDFRELASFEDDSETLKKKHFLIITIEQILELAKVNHWGLCKKHDFIYLYNSAFWSLLSEDDLKDFLGKSAEKMGIDKFDCRHYQFKEQLHKQFLSASKLPEPERKENVVLINLLNGTFEVTPNGGQLRPFNRNDFITYQLPFEYNPTAKAPKFKAYLNKVQPDKECQNLLAEYLAYIFTRHLKLEKTLLLYGTGANGKSVFFEIVNALLGKENVTSYSLQSLTDTTGYFRAKLANALLNYASEINGKLETSIFKQLVSGEPVEARLPYGEPFTLEEYARLIFNCNELPREVEHTNAYFRRFLIVPFKVTIPEAEQDKELATKIIKGELSGVFNWVLEGLERLLKQKNFTRSKAVEEQLSNYRIESDSVLMFIDENGFKPSLDEFKKLSEIHYQYKAFCMENGFRPTSSKTLIKRLENLGYENKKKNIGKVVYLAK